MNNERWRRITQLFEAALAKNPSERAAFLIEACADDPSLQPEVEALLVSDAKADGFLEPPAATTLTDITLTDIEKGL
jgi:eukaryotic-like serine/threonine-protein kinase